MASPPKPGMTLRQIEVIRSIMITGTIAGAAKLLNVSAPGISRLMKYSERSLNLKFFERQNGRYVPTPEAQNIFEQINGVYKKVDDLQFVLSSLARGTDNELEFGSVPSISNVMVPRAVERLREVHADLRLNINILKIEEAVDYLLLGKGELVVMSTRFDHPSIDFQPLARGELRCIVPANHALAGRTSISAREMALYPLIGIDPKDPYGSVMNEHFKRAGVNFDIVIKARFGTTVCSLVQAGLGIAVIDQFTIAHNAMPGIVAIKIEESTSFQTYVAVRTDRPRSIYADTFIRVLRQEMLAVAPDRPSR